MQNTKGVLLLIMGFMLCFTGCQSEKKKEETSVKIGVKKKESSPFDVGRAVFNGKGKCYTCHKVDKKSIGPSVIEIMKVYAEKEADVIAFLKQEAEPIVDPETYTVMKTNFSIIKTFTEEELKALEVYMTQISKQ